MSVLYSDERATFVMSLLVHRLAKANLETLAFSKKELGSSLLVAARAKASQMSLKGKARRRKAPAAEKAQPSETRSRF